MLTPSVRCVAMDVVDRRRQVPGRDVFAMPCPVLQDEGVVSLAADRSGMRKALVNGADIGEPAAGADDRERRAGTSAEEEQPRVVPGWLPLPLRFGVEAVEHGPAAGRLVDHAIERGCDDLRVDVSVIRQERADAGQRHLLVVSPIVPGQDQVSEAGERRVTQQIPDGVLHTKVAARDAAEQHGQEPRRRRECRLPSSSTHQHEEHPEDWERDFHGLLLQIGYSSEQPVSRRAADPSCRAYGFSDSSRRLPSPPSPP